MEAKRLSRRRFLQMSASTVTALGALSLAGCAPALPGAQPAGSGSGAAAPATETATLNFVVDTINEGHVQVRNEWSQKFSEQHEGITVNHQPVPGQDYNTRIQTLFAAGTPPDVYRYLQEITPIVTVVEKNLHLRLDDYVERDNYDLSDFRPDAVGLYAWDGGLYALPRDYGNQNLFYNLDLFEEAGLEPPSADWENTDYTFDVFLEQTQQLTKRSGNRTEQWGFLVNRGWRPWASWVYSNGGVAVNRDDRGMATEIALTEPNAVEAMQFLQDLMYTHEIAPRPDLESELGGFDLFASGRVAIMLTNPSAVNQFRTIEAFNWDVGALPIGNGDRRGTGGGGTGWAGTAATQIPDAVWEFLAFISSPEAELDEVRVGATTPSRVSVVMSEAFLDPNKPPKNAIGFAQAQEYVVRDPVHVNWPEIFQRILVPNMDRLWSGSASAQEVAEAIKSEADPLFAQ
jgi:multiple sugar transport system substrate-binding protein